MCGLQGCYNFEGYLNTPEGSHEDWRQLRFIYRVDQLDYEKESTISISYLHTLNKKGIALGNRGKYDEVIKFFDDAIRLDAKDVDAWNNKGVVFGALGRTSEANVGKAKAK
jgi:tetratricopeptide (TPR) repeat protein